MQYLSEEVAIEVNNALDDIEVEAATEVFKNQIMEDSDDYSSAPIDLLQPIIGKLQYIESLEGVDEDALYELRERVNEISMYVIRAISAKFGISIDADWLSMNNDRVRAIATALYKFFVLDFFYVVLGILSNYTIKHKDELYEIYKDIPSSSNVSYSANLKSYSAKDAIIMTRVHEITDYIFNILDIDIVFDYATANYIPAVIMKKLYEEMNCSGDFVHVFASIYKNNLALRSKIGFEIIFKVSGKAEGVVGGE